MPVVASACPHDRLASDARHLLPNVVNQTAGQTDAAPSYPSAAALGRKRESLRNRWRPSGDWQADAAGLEDRPARPSARERASTRASIPRRTAVSSGTRGDSAWISAASVVQGAVEPLHRRLLHTLAQRSARNRNRAAATSAWLIPESLPPVVHREPQRPRRPGQGQSKHAAMRRGLGLRRRDFASLLGRG